MARSSRLTSTKHYQVDAHLKWRHKHEHVVKSLLKMKADPQIRMTPVPGSVPSHTAADFARMVGASPEQAEYIEQRTHCANPGCAGRGLKQCARCQRVRYCGVECQHAHWPEHKPKCSKAAPKAVSKKEKKKKEKKKKKKKSQFIYPDENISI